MNQDRIQLARNGALNAEAISRLVRDPEEPVRVAVAANPNVTDDELITLASDASEQVRRAAGAELASRRALPDLRSERGSRFLDAGAFGDIFLVRTETGETFAKKIFAYKGMQGMEVEARARFVRGAILMRDHLTDHDQIVDVFSVNDEDGPTPWFTMEYVQGPDFGKLINNPAMYSADLGIRLDKGRIPLQVTVDILKDVVSAVRHAHGNEIIHRDIKPRNVLVYRSGGRVRAKLCDFDLAYTPAFQELSGSSTDMFGSHYVPPWLQLRTENETLISASPRSDSRCYQIDTYGLAATVFFALTETVPFAGQFVENQLKSFQSRVAGQPNEEGLGRLSGLIAAPLSAAMPDEISVTVAHIAEALEEAIEPGRSSSTIPAVVCMSRPSDRQVIRTDLEAKVIESFRSDVSSIEVTDILHAAHPRDLHETLLAKPETRLLWLAGHSDDQFYFQDDEGRSHPIGASQFEKMLRRNTPPKGRLQCVVLNSCNSHLIGEHLASTLHLPFVIVTTGSVTDDLALDFGAIFLEALSLGQGYQLSFDQACDIISVERSVDVPYELIKSKYPALSFWGSERLLAVLAEDESPTIARREAFQTLLQLGEKTIEGANLRGVDVSNLNASGVSLAGSDLSHTHGANFNLSGSTLDGCPLVSADLELCNLNDATATSCNMERMSIRRADANKFNATGSNLRGSNWFKVTATACNCVGSDFTGANLAEANLSRGVFVDCSFDSADLTRSILSRAIFRGADFGDADVHYADFSRTHLGGADLSRVKNLAEEQLFKVYWDSHTVWPEAFSPPPSANEVWTAK